MCRHFIPWGQTVYILSGTGTGFFHTADYKDEEWDGPNFMNYLRKYDCYAQEQFAFLDRFQLYLIFQTKNL